MAKTDWGVRYCAKHGHETYQPTESELAQRLSATLHDGSRIWKCLRCGAYVEASDSHVEGSVHDAPHVMRGQEVKDALILRLLAVERFCRCVLLILAGIGILKFAHSRAAVNTAVHNYLPLLGPFLQRIHFNVQEFSGYRELQKILHYSHHTLVLVAIGVIAYACLNGLEGTGLWLRKRWGEYVAVVSTSAFMPLEVLDIMHKHSPLGIVLFLINVAAVIYLLYAKRLFGLRGGEKRLEELRRQNSVLAQVQAQLKPTANV